MELIKLKNPAQIQRMIKDMFRATDIIEKNGLDLLFVDSDTGIRETIKLDFLMALFKVLKPDREVDYNAIDYLNETLDANYAYFEIEEMREKIAALNSPDSSILLPSLIMIDNGLDSPWLSEMYIKTLARFLFTFFVYSQCGAFEEISNYYKYINGCMELVNSAISLSIDYDPLESIDGDEAKDLVKRHAMLSSMLDSMDQVRREEKPFTSSMAEIIRRICSGEIEGFLSEDDDNELIELVNMLKNAGKAAKLFEPEHKVDQTERVDCPKALDELQDLIGLDDVKRQITSLLNAHLVNSSAKKMKVNRPPLSLHMVFTGNPGTGKTTVARLLGEIYKEAGLLSKGHFVEATRAELIGKYVGHTAVQVKEVFQKAQGGVLFIDEAYSLTDEDAGYGDEAISTLLKLMEDNRDDIAVIVAGYPKLMHDFLESNPGLKSRFPFVIDFPDYSGDELLQIFNSLCKGSGITPDRDVMRAVKAHFIRKAAKKTTGQGNARDVRNYFEKMLIKQANRLAYKDSYDKGDLCRFTIEDLPDEKTVSAIKRKPDIYSGRLISIEGR